MEQIARNSAVDKDGPMRHRPAADLESPEVGSVDYQITNSLTSVRALSEVLKEYPAIDPDRRQQFVNAILHETERIVRLLNQLNHRPEQLAAVVG